VFGYAAETVLTGYLEEALDLDHDPVKNRIPQLDPGMYADHTNIGGGMRVGIENLLNNPREDGEEAQRIMILMTDGHANVAEAPCTDPKASIEYYANLALAEGIIIHGVTLGSEADAESIEDAANLTGGIYRHVPEQNLEEMLEAFKEIGLNGGRAKLVK
jgi:Mg-chelatase subunit ChlD